MAQKDLYKLLQECTVRLSSSSGSGTGFFVAPDGWILTCDHVVAQSTAVSVVWISEGDRQEFTATVKLRLPIPIDIALLKVESKRVLQE
jgi:S1-C subfamily serine protease